MTHTRIPRRLFLSASLLAAASAACNLRPRINTTPAPPTATVTPLPLASPDVPRGVTSFIADALPDLAGRAIDLREDTITLQAVSGDASYPLSPDASVLDAQGYTTSPNDLAAGQTVAVWLNADRSAALVQILGDMGTLGPTLNAPLQSEPTGESTTIGGLPMTTRAGWGAAATNMDASAERGVFDAETNPAGWLMYPAPLADWLQTIVVHHTALTVTEGPREIQRSHQGAKGYADIAYHYLIDSFGALYEGRVIGARGSHTGGFNTGSIGIALLGNTQVMPVPRQPLATLVTLIAHLQAEYTITHLAGHRDFQPHDTECPGEALEALLPRIADELGLEFGTGGYVPPPWDA